MCCEFVGGNVGAHFDGTYVHYPFQVKAMVQGRDRRPELGFKLALECRKSIVYPMKNKNSKYNNTADSEQGGSMANVNESNHNSVKVTQQKNFIRT